MSIISDPESWMGLRSARALEDEAGSRPAPAPAAPRAPGARGDVLGGMVRRLLRIFGRG